ncbi:hypothetical protein FG877_02160 [Enterococcus casseliflavus]|nr:hypothetical protein [Enterococcus casseliflavus]
MSKNDGKVLFKKMIKSERSLDADELISLISASCVSRQALQRLTDNILRNDLARLEKNKLVKVKQTSVLSATAPQKYYYTSKFNIKSAKSIDLISYAVYALRQYAKIGRVNIKENGNALADLMIDDEYFSILEFISLDISTYERKLSMLNADNNQKVLVIDGRSLYANLVKNYRATLNNALVIVINDKNITLTYQASEFLSDDFDFNKLKKSKGRQVIEGIKENYNRAIKARQNSNLTNVKRGD